MKKILGIELGSTRIKAVLTDENANVIAQGSYEWENRFADGYWTYSLDDVWSGLQSSYEKLNSEYKAKFGSDITEITAIGISAMMHGYLAFDKTDRLLVPFRTWRNTNTAQAAEELSEKLNFNIPQRWTVAHFYQAVLNKEEHIKDVAFLTTLAGYVHYKLTGNKVIGIGDASGMFPIGHDSYDREMLDRVDGLLRAQGLNTKFELLLPKVLIAGENAGYLTAEGALLLDPTGKLKSGALFCPPEGDAGTGMVATNSIAPRTANVSAGTSAFLMVVLEKALKNVYKEIDVVTTPSGNDVAMVHVNNCTSEINAWAEMFKEVINIAGADIQKSDLMVKLFECSEMSDADIGGLTGYNFLSGEPIAGLTEGRPLVVRKPEGCLCLADFMRMQIYSAVATLRLGTEILNKENVALDSVCGHGGFFKTENVGQKVMAAALGAPVTVMKNAGEGGAWGIALLALYATDNDKTLYKFLNGIFSNADKKTIVPDEAEIDKFNNFMLRYKAGLNLALSATEVL